MKKLIILLTIIICYMESNAQFFHSIEFNNGISISEINDNNSYTYTDPVINQSNNNIHIFIGLSSAIKLNYWNHKYWNLSSETGFMELSQKANNEYYNLSNVKYIQYNNFYINMLHFNTLLEIKYPNWKIVPSLKIGPRLDYTFLNINNVYDLNKFNYGLILGIGFGYQLNNNLNIHLDFLNNWYKKDVINASYNFNDFPFPVYYPSYTVKKNFVITIGFGYTF